MWIEMIIRRFAYYWPLLIAAFYFACMNTWIMHKLYNKERLIRLFISFFLVSSAFLYIPGEYLSEITYNKAMTLLSYNDINSAVYVAWKIFSDFLIVIAGTILYSKITKLEFHISVTSYLQYACIERLCFVLAISPITYLVIFAINQFIAFKINRKDLEFMSRTRIINWKKLSIYLYGLLFILDAFYCAYYIFPNLGTDEINFPTIWIDILTLIITGFMIGIIKLSFNEGRLGASKLEYMQKFADSQEHIIQTLAELSEAKSGETGQHVKRVSEYCKHIALQMGVSEETTEFFKIASMMHDVGKLMIPKEIIEKPDGLTPDEYEIVKAHTLYGEELLSKSDGQIIEMAKVIACQHHERWDGTGYPRGLKEDQIDFFAQITSVADVYDALSNKRAYKPAWKPEDALNEILKNKGTQFSPAVVDAFSAVYDKIEEVRKRYQD